MPGAGRGAATPEDGHVSGLGGIYLLPYREPAAGEAGQSMARLCGVLRADVHGYQVHPAGAPGDGAVVVPFGKQHAHRIEDDGVAGLAFLLSMAQIAGSVVE